MNTRVSVETIALSDFVHFVRTFNEKSVKRLIHQEIPPPQKNPKEASARLGEGPLAVRCN